MTYLWYKYSFLATNTQLQMCQVKCLSVCLSVRPSIHPSINLQGPPDERRDTPWTGHQFRSNVPLTVLLSRDSTKYHTVNEINIQKPAKSDSLLRIQALFNFSLTILKKQTNTGIRVSLIYPQAWWLCFGQLFWWQTFNVHSIFVQKS